MNSKKSLHHNRNQQETNARYNGGLETSASFCVHVVSMTRLPHCNKAPRRGAFLRTRNQFIFLPPSPRSSTYSAGTPCHARSTSLPLLACTWCADRNRIDPYVFE